MVEIAGFEPATFAMRMRRSSQLSYIPKLLRPTITGLRKKERAAALFSPFFGKNGPLREPPMLISNY